MTLDSRSTLVLPRGTARALQDLTGEPRPDVALLLVLRDALAYRLGQMETGLQALEKKYGTTFDKHRKRWEIEDHDDDYRWEAERDYLEWEALVIRKRRLEDVYSWLS